MTIRSGDSMTTFFQPAFHSAPADEHVVDEVALGDADARPPHRAPGAGRP
jgi:hypothetical protein